MINRLRVAISGSATLPSQAQDATPVAAKTTVTRRICFGIAAAVVLAGCASPSFENRLAGQALNVTQVDVMTAGPIEGRANEVMEAQFRDDLTQALTQQLTAASSPDGSPVTVSITVSDAQLATRARRVIAGTSFIEGTVSVTGTDGAILLAATPIRGNSEGVRLAGPPGAIAAPSVENDYRRTIQGFAQVVRDALFGASDG